VLALSFAAPDCMARLENPRLKIAPPITRAALLARAEL